MVHKMIKKVTEDYIVPKDDADVKELLGKAKKEIKDEDDGDIMDDYDEGMQEFTDSLKGKEEKEPSETKTEEIRALG